MKRNRDNDFNQAAAAVLASPSPSKSPMFPLDHPWYDPRLVDPRTDPVRHQKSR